MEIGELRDTTEDHVIAALDDAYVKFPIKTPAELLEAFNLILDVRLGEVDD